jgi:hypothetical protein
MAQQPLLTLVPAMHTAGDVNIRLICTSTVLYLLFIVLLLDLVGTVSHSMRSPRPVHSCRPVAGADRGPLCCGGGGGGAAAP